LSADERLRRALDTLDAAAREQRERRALTELRLAETETKARAAFQKEIDSAVKYADHMAELNRRKQEAGGWATEKTLSDKDNVMGFGPDEAERPPVATGNADGRTESTTAPATRRGRHVRRDENFDDEDFSNTNWLD
jgi:hypothetical protein